MYFVVYIWDSNKVKLYMGFAARNAPNTVATRGVPVRDEAVFRNLFPQFEAYEFIS